MASLDANMHPALAGWFRAKFGNPTDVQIRAWAGIATGSHTLIAAPTGSGKTLAALLPCLDRIIQEKAAESKRVPGVRTLYITPLKALNNDIHHHAVGFIEELEQFAEAAQEKLVRVTAAVRTGDTSQSARAAMLRTPPDVLVTTPESLYLMMTSQKGRDILKTVRQVIVDEIHSLAADKRGSHLMLTLERLVEWCGGPVQRIGVSATQKPLERVARFLGGWEAAEPGTGAGTGAGAGTGTGAGIGAEAEAGVAAQDQGGSTLGSAGSVQQPVGAMVSTVEDAEANEDLRFIHPFGYRPRPVHIVESKMEKVIELQVTMPDPKAPAKTRDAVWIPFMDRIIQLMEGCRSVLIFANSRRMCERLCLRLNDYVGYEMTRAHHGSVSREKRLEIERMLKAGELRCLVATSSLELGIDVGHVDLVIQIDSPMEAASGIQRVGRAGHAAGIASRGVVIARHRGALPEIAVLSRLIASRDIEPIRVPRNRIDVLSQQCTAMVATDGWHLDRLHAVIARCDSFRAFPRERLEGMLRVLAGFYPFARPVIDWDRDTGQLAGRRNTLMAAVTGAGTIPQSSAYPVHHADSRLHLGELDETYVFESRVGDVFQLGTQSWMIREIAGDKVYVVETANRLSEVPFWQADISGRSFALGEKVGAFLSELIVRLGLKESAGDAAAPSSERKSRMLGEPAEGGDTERLRRSDIEATAWLEQQYHLDARTSESLIGYIRGQHAACAVPTHRRIVIEHYRDLMNQVHVVIHSVWGRRFNRTWQLALRQHLEQTLPYRFYSNAKDNGIEFIFSEWDYSWLQSFWQVTSARVEPLISEALPSSPLLPATFRRIAETSLLLARSFRRMPTWQRRLRSEELLKESLPFAEHFPYLQEAIDECLQEHFDIRHVMLVLDRIVAGEVEVVVRECDNPSPMAAQFVADYVTMNMYESDALNDDVQLQLLSVSKEMAGELFGREAVLRSFEPSIVAEERKRLAEGDEPPQDAEDLLRLLKRRGDITRAELLRTTGAEPAAAEAAGQWLDELIRSKRAEEVVVGGERRFICRDERETYAEFPGDPAARAFVLNRFIENRISFTADDLGQHYGLPEAIAEEAIAKWADMRVIEPAPFAGEGETGLWISSKIAARIVRLSISHHRKQAEPVDPAKWCGEMLRRHRLQAEAKPMGIDGLRSVLAQLQGLFLPLPHWESIVLPARLADYRPADLDLLCASGELFWIGKKDDQEKEGKIAFFLSESKELYMPIVKTVNAAVKGASGETEEDASRGVAENLASSREDEAQKPDGADSNPQAADSKHPDLLELLQRKGAMFLTQLSRDSNRLPSELLNDLFELVWEGKVANDQFSPLRVHLQARSKKPPKQGSGLGRWYAVSALADEAEAPEPEQSVVRWAHHLLNGYGMMTKDIVAEACPYSWDTMLSVLKRLEEWGAVTRGMFIQGVSSLQFTTHEIASSMRKAQNVSDAEDVPQPLTLLCAVDPANPYGTLMPWPDKKGIAFSRKPGNYIVQQGDRWLYWVENNGKKIFTMDSGSSVSELKPLFRAIMRQQHRSKIVIDTWDGEKVTDTASGQELQAMGAEKDKTSLVLWPSSLQ